MRIRKCAWAFPNEATDKKAVWARKSVTCERCPKSVVTAESLTYLEQFSVWKQLGGQSLWEFDAKAADAMILLDQEWQKEGEKDER